MVAYIKSRDGFRINQTQYLGVFLFLLELSCSVEYLDISLFINYQLIVVHLQHLIQNSRVEFEI